MQGPGLFESVSRRAFWAWTLSLTLVLALLTWWAGLYQVVEEETAEQRIVDPTQVNITELGLVGQIIVGLCLQFVVANILFWSGVWVARRTGLLKP
jgi:hypothetical protein